MKKKPSKVTGMEAFYTRENANIGIQLPLVDPVTGKDTEHWLRIRGRDSDVFRQEEIASLQRVRELFEKDGSKASGKLEEIQATEVRRLNASLVIAWSFDKPCTLETVIEFFKEAPQIADSVSRMAVKRALFTKSVSSNLLDTPKPNSSSTSTLKTQNNPSE
jgi:hypothetical protein